MSGYDYSTDPDRIDAAAAHAFLTRSTWSPGIPLDVVARAIANSVCVAAFHGGRQVGFARAVTDRATFAYLADVHVLEEHRGKGVSRGMLETLLAHPDLQGLRRMLLATRDAHGLYRKFGFAPLASPGMFMEILRPDLYRDRGGTTR